MCCLHVLGWRTPPALSLAGMALPCRSSLSSGSLWERLAGNCLPSAQHMPRVCLLQTDKFKACLHAARCASQLAWYRARQAGNDLRSPTLPCTTRLCAPREVVLLRTWRQDSDDGTFIVL